MTLLADPNSAVVLILAGTFLIYAECNRPGTVVLGSLGVFAVTLGVYDLAQHRLHPVAGLLLITGIGLLLLDLVARTRYLFALVGIAAIVYALATLTSPRIHPAVALATGSAFALVTLPLASVALRARRNKRTVRTPAPNLQPSSRTAAE